MEQFFTDTQLFNYKLNQFLMMDGEKIISLSIGSVVNVPAN